jgi:competence ComEA-like helix-hairpin-helix protein
MIKRASEDEWAEEVDKMVSRGAILTDDETDQVIEYLSTHYGPDDSKGEHPAAPGSAGQPSSPQTSPSDNSAPPAVSPSAAAPHSSDTSSPVNVNKAGVQELESSLGLSETEAEAIVHHREQNGNFKTWQEVSSVPGVPAEKISNNQKRLVF